MHREEQRGRKLETGTQRQGQWTQFKQEVTAQNWQWRWRREGKYKSFLGGWVIQGCWPIRCGRYQRWRRQAPWDAQFSDAVKPNWESEKRSRRGGGWVSRVLTSRHWTWCWGAHRTTGWRWPIYTPTYLFPSALLQGADCKIKQTAEGGQRPAELEAQLQQSGHFSWILHWLDFTHDFQVHVSSRSTPGPWEGEASKGKEGCGWEAGGPLGCESKLLPSVLHDLVTPCVFPFDLAVRN